MVSTIPSRKEHTTIASIQQSKRKTNWHDCSRLAVRRTLKEGDSLRISSASVRNDLIADIKKWMDESNIAYIQSPVEAESQLVELEQKKLIDAIISEDGDCLVDSCLNTQASTCWDASQRSVLLSCRANDKLRN